MDLLYLPRRECYMIIITVEVVPQSLGRRRTIASRRVIAITITIPGTCPPSASEEGHNNGSIVARPAGIIRGGRGNGTDTCTYASPHHPQTQRSDGSRTARRCTDAGTKAIRPHQTTTAAAAPTSGSRTARRPCTDAGAKAIRPHHQTTGTTTAAAAAARIVVQGKRRGVECAIGGITSEGTAPAWGAAPWTKPATTAGMRHPIRPHQTNSSRTTPRPSCTDAGTKADAGTARGCLAPGRGRTAAAAAAAARIVARSTTTRSAPAGAQGAAPWTEPATTAAAKGQGPAARVADGTDRWLV